MQEILDMAAGRVDKAMRAISAAGVGLTPTLGVILGSGQGGFSRRLAAATFVPFRKIPYFFHPTVPGHEGIMSVGTLEGLPVAVLEGRIHLYEGYFMREIVFPVRVLQRLGVRDLIVCCAAGGLSPRLAVGQVMAVCDHLNLMGTNPLIGQCHQGEGASFLSMVGTYDAGFRALAREAGREAGEEIPEGVLAAVPGPCYETPAESRMLSVLGADAVTMSSVPEIIMARFLGMRVLCLSLITNVHGSDRGMDHGEVLQVARGRTGFLMDLIERVTTAIGRGVTGGDRSGQACASERRV